LRAIELEISVADSNSDPPPGEQPCHVLGQVRRRTEDVNVLWTGQPDRRERFKYIRSGLGRFRWWKKPQALWADDLIIELPAFIRVG
jgi:hypothetical protein